MYHQHLEPSADVKKYCSGRYTGCKGGAKDRSRKRGTEAEDLLKGTGRDKHPEQIMHTAKSLCGIAAVQMENPLTKVGLALGEQVWAARSRSECCANCRRAFTSQVLQNWFKRD